MFVCATGNSGTFAAVVTCGRAQIHCRVDLQHRFLDWSSIFRKIVGLQEFQENFCVGIINDSFKDVLRIRSTA